jgi:dCMP deaminase
MQKIEKIIIAYVPVLHNGYRKFFESHKDAEVLYIFGESLVKKYDYLAKEIRQLDPVLGLPRIAN